MKFNSLANITVRSMYFFFACVTLLCLVLVIYSVKSDHTRSARETHIIQQLLDIGKANKQNGEAIRDCTVAGGKCYERGAQGLAILIEKENKIINNQLKILAELKG